MDKDWSEIPKYGLVKKPVYRYGLVVFLYAIVNAITCYILPIFLEEEIGNLSLVGLVLASSSIWNIATDIFFSFRQKTISYVKLIRVVGLVAFLIFLGLYINVSVVMLIICSFLWGIYTEVYAFARFDFEQVLEDEGESGAKNFGMIENFFSLGSMVGPILASALVLISHKLVTFTGMYLIVAMLLVFTIFIRLKKLPIDAEDKIRRLSFASQLRRWKKLGVKILPLILTFLINGMADGAIFSFLPIFAIKTPQLSVYGGIIMASVFLPMVLFSGLMGWLADRVGKLKFIRMGMGIAGLALLVFGFSTNVFLTVSLAFIYGLGFSMFISSILSMEGIFIHKHKSSEGKIIGQTGIAYNLGFIIGAILMGVIVSTTGSFGIGFAVFGVGYLVLLGIYGIKGKKLLI
jgi:MFS family permease